MPTLSQEFVDMGSAQLQLQVGFIARRSMLPSFRKSFRLDLFAWIFLAFICFAEDASATDIESMLSSRSESRVTMATLNECNLVIEASYPRNINTELYKPEGVKKALKTVWVIDLSTVGHVKVAPVHGDMHVGFWPPRRSWVSKLLGCANKVGYTETIYYSNGDASVQSGHISAGVVIPKAPEPDLAKMLTDYVDKRCN